MPKDGDPVYNIEDTLDLPQHDGKLYEMEQYVGTFNRRLAYTMDMSVDDYNKLYEQITNVLYLAGDLSKTRFDIADELEQYYYSTHKNAPELAKKLWLEHYDRLHKPYNRVKNKLFSLYIALSKRYHKLNGEQPPK